MKQLITAIAISATLAAPYTVAKDYTLAELGLNGMSVPKTSGDHLALGLKHMPIAKDVWDDAGAGWRFDETPFGNTATNSSSGGYEVGGLILDPGTDNSVAGLILDSDNGFDETPFGDTATSGSTKTAKYIDMGLNHQPVLSK